MSVTAEALARILLLDNEYSKYFSLLNIANYAFRYLGQLLSKLINIIFEPASDFINQIYKYATGSGIAQNSGILNSISNFNFIIPILIIISIIIYAASLSFNPNESKVHAYNLVKNFMIALVILFGSVSMFSALNNITYKSIQFIDIGYSTTQYGQTVKNYTYDLVYLLNNVNSNGKISQDAIKQKNNLSVEYCANINPVEVIDEPKDVITQGSRKNDVIEMLNYKPYASVNGKDIEFTELENKFLIDEYYYRYSINWLIIIIIQICSMLVLAVTCIGIIRRVFDATIGFIILTVTSFADLTRGKITKNLIEYILKCYITLVLTALVYKIYSYLMATIPSDFNTFGQLIIILALTYIAIDGPAVVEKVATGQDAGIGDGFKAMSQMRNSISMMKELKNDISSFKDSVLNFGSNLSKNNNSDLNNNLKSDTNAKNTNDNNKNSDSNMNKDMNKDINGDNNSKNNVEGINNNDNMSNGFNDDINDMNKTSDDMSSGFNDDMNNDMSNAMNNDISNDINNSTYDNSNSLNNDINSHSINNSINNNNMNNQINNDINK